MIDTVKTLCEKFYEPRGVVKDSFLETPVDFGIKRQRERIYMICDYALKQDNSYDVLQIGCGNGRVSNILGEIVSRHDKTLTCIDPFNTLKTVSGSEKRTQNYYEFLNNTRAFGDRVHVHMENSNTEMSDALIQLIEYSFVYIDGKSSYDAHANDIYLASRKNKGFGIICLDNLRVDGKKQYMLDLYQDMINKYGFGYYWNQGQREGYLFT